jgi:hypothetical protein
MIIGHNALPGALRPWLSDNLPRAYVVGERVVAPELDRKDRECLCCLGLPARLGIRQRSVDGLSG